MDMKNHTQLYQQWVWFDNKSFELNKQIGQTFIKADRYPASQPHLCFDRNSLKHSDWIHEYKQRLWQLVRNFEMEQRPSARGNEMQPRLSCFLSHCAWAERNSGIRRPSLLPSSLLSCCCYNSTLTAKWRHTGSEIKTPYTRRLNCYSCSCISLNLTYFTFQT